MSSFVRRLLLIGLPLLILSVAVGFHFKVNASYLYPNPPGRPPHVRAPDCQSAKQILYDSNRNGVIAPPDASLFPDGKIFGRCLNAGYFTGELRLTANPPGPDLSEPSEEPGAFWYFTDPGGDGSVYPDEVYPGNPQAVNKFIEWHDRALNNPNSILNYSAETRSWADCWANPGLPCNGPDSPDPTSKADQATMLRETSAYIINTMLKKSGTDFGCPNYGESGFANGNNAKDAACRANGIKFAQDNFSHWERLVRDYNAKGWINWNIRIKIDPIINTSTVGHLNFPSDVTNWMVNGAADVEVIRFRDPSDPLGKEYDIIRSCWNTKGFVPLKDFDIEGKFESPFPAANIVEPEKTYTIGVKIENFGELESPPVQPLLVTFLRVKNINSNYAAHDSMSDTDIRSPPLNPGGDGGGYGYGNSPFCFGQTPCWTWHYGSGALKPQGSYSDEAHTQFSFKVAANAPDGQQLCFQTYVRFQNTGYYDHVGTIANGGYYCVTVRIPREPFVTTQQGDVQGGVAQWSDDPCLVTNDPSPGTVRGKVKQTGSKADYVVSAGGQVSNFGSAGIPSSDALTLGKLPPGNYGEVCRADLAKRYLNDDPQPPLGLGNSTSIGAVMSKSNGVYTVDGNLQLAGGTVGVGKNITLVVKGDVYITSNITAANGFNIQTIPSLGIIASGNIHIAPSVASLYGIYVAGTNHDVANGGWNPGHSAGGIINTCRKDFGRAVGPPHIQIADTDPASDADEFGSNECQTSLTVKGALAGINIYFRRTSGDAKIAGSAAAETVNFIPQLLLNPPQGLSGVAGDIRHQGERPPVF